MPIWYNPPSKDSKFANLACTDWANINTKITFKEVGIKEDDTFYYLYGQAESASDLIYVKGGRDWKFEPQLVNFRIAKKTYDKWNSEEKKNVPTDQSVVEAFYCKAFSDLDTSKVYSGKMTFQNIPQIEMVLNGEAYGEPISEQMVNLTIQSMISLEEIKEPELIKLDEIKLPTKSSNWGSTKSQSEYEKLNDRMKWTCEQLKLCFPELELNTSADIIKQFTSDKVPSNFAAAWEILVIFLGSKS